MNKFFCFALVSIAAAACNSGTANYKESTANPSPTFTVPAAPVSVVADTNKKQPVTTTTQIQPVTAPVTQTKTTSTALNPAHGQPGHRCDIAEGSPLNSTPVINNNVPANNNNVVVNPPVQSLPAKTNVKLNPAHGLPGHDCAIGVGQPLKS